MKEAVEKGVLVFTRIELFFFLIAGMLFCFGFGMKTVGNTLMFSVVTEYCCTEPRLFQIFVLHCQQGAGGE